MNISDISTKEIEQAELISIKYAYSRLYVGLTRAFKKVFLIEDNDGMEFWKSLNYLS